ncbi:MAG: tRNA uridine-5-carboxymethylaminomethyl(34) synthesis GTPase MnmE [Planctomycetes bacterium]|nr:tRNA uridine-5-carboxymethylaminomethyl(34) synthesis GTPase MnmE [Planctomycetota bacterium]
MSNTGDTIVAVSTPPGASILGIVRLSGSDAFRIISEFINKPAEGLRNLPCYSVVNARFRLKTLRRSMKIALFLMKAPYSFTKEDVVEIHVWGLPFLMRAIVDELASAGARLAQPGEFTRRAFLNGRIDLAQAESTLSIISAQSEAERRQAVAGVKGVFSKKIHGLSRRIVDLMSFIEAGLDFSDQDIEITPPEAVKSELAGIIHEIKQTLSQYRLNRVYDEKLRIAVIGRTNAGKSSIFNRLAKERRNIVSKTAGTTRDAVEHTIRLGHMAVSVYDTAGIRNPRSEIEKNSIEVSYHTLEMADLVLLVFDGSKKSSENLEDISQKLYGRKCIILINKTDLKMNIRMNAIKKAFPDVPVIFTSAKTGRGIAELRRRIVEEITGKHTAVREFGFISGIRHESALKNALKALELASEGLSTGMEFVAADIRESLNNLGEITGETTAEDILDNIFSRFCIGK